MQTCSTSSRLARALATAVLLIVPLIAGSSVAAEFTPAQRAEIVQIVREALKQDPSILRDAVDALRQETHGRMPMPHGRRSWRIAMRW